MNTAGDTWAALLDAHQRANESGETGLVVHAPKAAVLCCSDARVPPSVIFDQPAGSLFVVRIAGNTAAPAAVASLDYAVDHLGVELVVVLGHTHCGAVAAAVEGASGGDLSAITAPICALAAASPDATADDITRHNVESTVADLLADDGPTGCAARAGRVRIEGALHDLRSRQILPLPVERPANP